jgi:hypothetical protein
MGHGAAGPSSAVQHPTTSITAPTRIAAKLRVGPARRGSQPSGQANDGATATRRVTAPTAATSQREAPSTAACSPGSPALTRSTVTTAATQVPRIDTVASSGAVYLLSRSRQPAAPVSSATRRSLSRRLLSTRSAPTGSTVDPPPRARSGMSLHVPSPPVLAGPTPGALL